MMLGQGLTTQLVGAKWKRNQGMLPAYLVICDSRSIKLALQIHAPLELRYCMRRVHVGEKSPRPAQSPDSSLYVLETELV